MEFTGERIIPGQVDDDLFHEHVSRYRLASNLAAGKRCLDAGCGLGYGSEILAEAATAVTAVDVDQTTVRAAQETHRAKRLEFTVADVCRLPFGDRQFDLSVSFEVIEHLADWQLFLRELSRVTAPDGTALISTPNRDYYAEARGDSGPNPFHIHEFDYSEFKAALHQVFEYIILVGQNVVPAISFLQAGHVPNFQVFTENGSFNPAEAQFYVAICSNRPLQLNSDFVYLASSGNVLQERARHIKLLEAEVRTKTQWLEQAKSALESLQHIHEKVELELADRSAWAIQTADELDQKCAELATAVTALHKAEETVVERTNWAHRLDRHNLELRERISQLDHALASATDSMAEAVARAERLTDQLDALTAAFDDNQLSWHRELLLLAEMVGFDTTSGEPTLPAIIETLHKLAAAAEERTAILDHLSKSRWLRLGRLLGVGPQLR